MIELASLAESSSATTQQVAASTQQTAATAGQLAASAQRLDGAAEALNGLVVQFTVHALEHGAGALGDVLAREAEVLVERACRGADAPKPSIATTSPWSPTQRCQPSGLAASTATRAFTDGGSTLSR